MSGPDRRRLLQTLGAGGLWLALGPEAADAAPGGAPAGAQLNGWFHLAPDGAVTIFVNSTDLGQGSQSGMAQVMAEELGCDWARVRIAQAPVEPAFFKAGGGYSTGGSSAVCTQFDRLRKVGAQARAMLTEAAAQRWGVAAAACEAGHGEVRHSPSRRRAAYGELASACAALPPPADPPLKPRSAWTLIGTSAQRIDIPPKVDGRAVYAIDVKLPGLLTAAVAQCPIYGGKLAKMDEAAARAAPGVRRVARLAAWRDSEFSNMPLQETVAVIADGYWPATQGLKALAPTWEAPAQPFSTEALGKALHADLDGGDDPALKRKAVTQGTADEAEARRRVAAAFAPGASMLAADYDVPMLAHATMEPMTAVARWTGGTLEIWTGGQAQQVMKQVCARKFGVKEDAVTVHTTSAGGGFGRRYYPDSGLQAAELSRLAGAPVKVIWSRPEDMQHDLYRPPAVARFEAALGADGRPAAVRMRQARIALFDADEMYRGLPYDWGAFVGDFSMRPVEVSWGAWRAVEHGPQAFMIESFVDEMAHAAGADPIAYRRAMLAADTRAQRLLDVVAEQSGWGRPPGPGRGRGVAIAWANRSIAAQVAEVSVEGQQLKVERVTCAFDCGTTVNPDGVRAQGEGSIIFGLSAALYGDVSFKDGRVEQANFDTYPVLKLAQSPQIDVHILESPQAEIGGAGEPMTVPIAPAVANAVFAATGRRIRALPLAKAGLKA